MQLKVSYDEIVDRGEWDSFAKDFGIEVKRKSQSFLDTEVYLNEEQAMKYKLLPAKKEKKK